MASLGHLKRKLKSVNITRQLTTAMKTVSSAKYAKINKKFLLYKPYSDSLDSLSVYCKNLKPEAPGESCDTQGECYVVLGYNRGFCGDYNAELNLFAQQTLEKTQNDLILVSGKKAVDYFEQKIRRKVEEYILPDVPDFSSCKQLIDTVVNLFASGKVKKVNIIYQKFINSIQHSPTLLQFLPFEDTGDGVDDETLFLPDRQTVESDMQIKVIKSKLYKIILEAALSAQSATLVAMRTAVDHANETAEILENEIHKKRQNAVTSGVIETSSNLTVE